MDIKSWILLVGSLLIVAVICHGFWTAYRTRSEPFRLDIAPDIPVDEIDDLEMLRGELPNGGARANRPKARGGRRRQPPPNQTAFELESEQADPPQASSGQQAPLLMDTAESPGRREPIVEFPDQVQASAPKTRRRSETTRVARAEPRLEQAPVEELVVLNVMAKSRPFDGGDLLELFLRNAVKFGDMNIFHRIDPVTKTSQYSVASVTEPGTFDLRSMDDVDYKGLCMFMQLPGPSQATKVFTDMLTVAEKLARQLDGEVCDEQFNRLTRQSTEHYRQRVAEFTRRHMSRRA
jgi:cell division protein ZipA